MATFLALLMTGLISVAEYESMQETLDILSDEETLGDLRQSREDFAVSGDPAEHEPYSVGLSGQAHRNIREHLPLEVAAAALETIEGSIAVNP